MDLDDLDVVTGANAGFDVNIFNPKTDEFTNVFITVLGADSDEARAIEVAADRERLKGAMKHGQVVKAKLLDDDKMATDIAKLAGMTKGWYEMVDDAVSEGQDPVKKKDTTIFFKGQARECNFENAKLLYTTNPVIRDQVWAAAHNRINFMKG